MTDNHDRAIGRIEGKLDRLLSDKDYEKKKWAELYKRISSYECKVDSTVRRLEKIEKPIAELNKWRERMLGAAMLISVSAALIGGAVASYWNKLADIFKG